MTAAADIFPRASRTTSLGVSVSVRRGRSTRLRVTGSGRSRAHRFFFVFFFVRRNDERYLIARVDTNGFREDFFFYLSPSFSSGGQNESKTRGRCPVVASVVGLDEPVAGSPDRPGEGENLCA